ncbi:MAG: DegV family protein [Clostridiales bacterium]|nr:DegV family protein [Clostridiales bacterium]
MLQLFTDSDTDFSLKECEEYGYKLISMPYDIDGQTVCPYEDFEEFDYHEFYERLRKGTLPKTFMLPESKYIEYFEPSFKKGDDILYVHFSAAMSGTFEAMNRAVQTLLEKYPERKFYAIDTKAITILSYAIVKEVGELAKKGYTAEQLVEWAKTEVDKFAVYFYADDLKFFGRSGRVGHLTAKMGNLFGIRPILTMNSEGKMDSIAKGKGKADTLKKILEYVRTLQDDIKSHTVIIGHADAYDLALGIESMLKNEYGEDLDTKIVVVNPTAGSHCGPDTVGVCFHAIHR